MIPQLFLRSLPEKNAILPISTAFLLVALVLRHHLLLSLLQETNKGEHTNHEPFFCNSILVRYSNGSWAGFEERRRSNPAISPFLHSSNPSQRVWAIFIPADDVFSPILFRVNVITLFARRRSTSLTEGREEEVKKGKL